MEAAFSLKTGLLPTPDSPSRGTPLEVAPAGSGDLVHTRTGLWINLRKDSASRVRNMWNMLWNLRETKLFSLC